MDRMMISQQEWEIDYIASKFGISRKQVREALKVTQSRSRRRVYSYIRDTYPVASSGEYEKISL